MGRPLPLANEHKLLGAMDIVAASLGEAENYIVVKSAIGERLRWDLSEIDTSGGYARTDHARSMLPKLLVAYLDAALS